jgi:hypothetical protein
MASTRNPVWAELIQLVPVICLAFPFIIAGKVDLAQAGLGFLIGAPLALVISAVVVWRKHLLNPILVGTGLWLCLGALAFQVPLPSIAAWLVQTQAFSLFAAALLVGIVATLGFPRGYIACHSSDPRWIKKTSFGLLGLTALIVIWAWLFRHDIRLGGGLPFIVLNVTRRVIARRAPLG